jgi:hypothetical protein
MDALGSVGFVAGIPLATTGVKRSKRRVGAALDIHFSFI